MAMVFNGLEELQAGLLERANLDAVKQVVKENGANLQETMQKNANFVKGYQTGTTKRSIMLQLRDGGLTAAVSPGTYYSPYLEYGTRKMQAQPFVRPAFETAKAKFKSDLERLVR